MRDVPHSFQALADLLKHESQDLDIRINFKMCVDCHAFFKGASRVLNQRIFLREPKLAHTFEDGSCACGDLWRWEERRGRG